MEGEVDMPGHDDEILQRLARLEEKADTQAAAMLSLAKKLERLPCFDAGPDSHAVAIDRLQQAEVRRERTVNRLWAAIAAIGATVGGVIIERILK
jgi:hypothetical protein